MLDAIVTKTHQFIRRVKKSNSDQSPPRVRKPKTKPLVVQHIFCFVAAGEPTNSKLVSESYFEIGSTSNRGRADRDVHYVEDVAALANDLYRIFVRPHERRRAQVSFGHEFRPGNLPEGISEYKPVFIQLVSGDVFHSAQHLQAVTETPEGAAILAQLKPVEERPYFKLMTAAEQSRIRNHPPSGEKFVDTPRGLETHF